MTIIHIAHATNIDLIDHISVLWKSLTLNNPDHQFALHLLHSIVDSSAVDKFKVDFEAVYPRVGLSTHYVDVSGMVYSNNFKHGTMATILRCVIPTVLSDIKKILYLDIDVLITGDLEPIWRLDCGETGLCLKSSIHPDWRMRDGYRCGNTGVMLMDLERLRSNGFVEKVLESNSQKSEEAQTLINRYAEGRYSDLAGNMNIFMCQDDAVYEDPIVYNIVGPKKPWNSSESDIQCDLWRSYRDIVISKKLQVTRGIGIGVLCYTTTNLGDWTQSAAALYVWWVYFDRPGTFREFIETCIATSKMGAYPITWINRDRISLATKPEGVDRVVILCNGWWMHTYKRLYNFIPPDWIRPIYISLHIAAPVLLTSSVCDYLRGYEPIGCRDSATVKLLMDRGVKAYFSGCLTMTLNLRDPKIGFTPHSRYKDKTVYLDYKCPPATRAVKLTQRIKTTDNSNLILTMQRCLDLLVAKQVYTVRLHVWLPLICNKAHIKLMNSSAGREFEKGDRDNHAKKTDRFTGLFETISTKSTLTCFKALLLNRTLYQIEKSM
uniref:Glycosyltransferase n=1 Tax=viral metagenome TaxID=1070528 RepID=A0A6C0DVZ0_9ZZZZ